MIPADKLVLRALLPLALLAACGDDPKTPGETKDPLPTPLVITADWAAGTLSFASLSALIGMEARSEAVVSTLDLSEYVPGPLALELTHDKKKVLVAASPGFFSVPGAGELLLGRPVPAGAGKLVVVDIDRQEIEAAIDTGVTPMGIAITPDNQRAFVAHFDSGNMAVVDLTTYQIVANVEIGPYAEEIAFDDTGTVGIVGYSDDGSLRTFGVADPENTLSPQVKLDGDSAGVAFFPDTKLAFIVEAPNPYAVALGQAVSGYNLLDVSNPSDPKVLVHEREPVIAGAYPVAIARNRGTLLVPTAQDNVFGVREYALEGTEVKLVQDVRVGEAEFLGALGFAYDGVNTVVMAMPGQGSLILTNLDTQASHTIDWEQDEAGPADVVIR